MYPTGGRDGVPVAVGEGDGEAEGDGEGDGEGAVEVGVGGVAVSSPGGLFVPVTGGGEEVLEGSGLDTGAVAEGWVATVGGTGVSLGVALGSSTTKGIKTSGSADPPAPGVRKVSNQLMGVRIAGRIG